MAARKIDTAAVFERLFDVYKAQFGLFVPAALILFAIPALLQGIAVEAGSVGLAFVGAAISVIATIWFQGMIVEAVRDIRDGKRDFTVGELLRAVVPVILPLFLAGLLAGILIMLGFILLIIPGLILLTLFAVVAPAVVIERRSPVKALSRSRELVSGNGWRVFGVIVVAFLLQAIVGQILGAIIRAIDDGVVGITLATLLSNALIAPVTGIAAALLYFALREAHGESEVPAGATPAYAAQPTAPTQTSEAPAQSYEPPAPAAPQPSGAGRTAAPAPPPPAAPESPAPPASDPPPSGTEPAADPLAAGGPRRARAAAGPLRTARRRPGRR